MSLWRYDIERWSNPFAVLSLTMGAEVGTVEGATVGKRQSVQSPLG